MHDEDERDETVNSKKRKVHICMVDPNIHNEMQLYAFLQLDNVEDLAYEFVWDERNPQFIVVTNRIYMDVEIRKRFEQLCNDGVISIFVACECMAPDLNLFDYAICFDDSVGEGRVISHVHRDFYCEYISKRKNDLAYDIVSARKALLNKTGFCNFIYSNPKGHESREKIFYALNEYKKVDSLGAFLNNTGYSDGNRDILERVRGSVDLKSRYKFTVAFENATSRGYTSEKIFTSLEAHSIPIYWGNPEIGKIANEKAFINCHQYDTFEQVVERVKEIDADDDMWCKMVCEPWLTEEQEKEEKKRKEDYHTFLENIFLQDSGMGGLKRGSGTYADLYRDFILGNNAQYEKVNANLNVCIKWIRLLQEGKSIIDFIKAKKYQTVAVYGMGAMGISAYEELEKYKDLGSLYGIDKGNPMIPSHIRNMRLYEVDTAERPDAVIVTVIWDLDNISRELDRLFGCDVYSIEEVIDSVLEQ